MDKQPLLSGKKILIIIKLYFRLISTAIGGSMIEEWMTNETIANSCQNVSIASHNEMLWDNNVVPYLKTTVKGWLWL